MLKPIPRQILSQTMVLHIPTSCDADYNVQYRNITVNRVHLQDDRSILKQNDNTEIQRRGVLFIDGRLSSPRLDYIALEHDANVVGANLRCTVDGYNYEVITVDAVPDDHGHLHHYEVSVV